MANFLTKAKLYTNMADLRKDLGLAQSQPVFNSEMLLFKVPGLQMAAVPFETTSLHGICSFGENGKDDVILLNSNRQYIEQNFDRMHEYVHLHEHRYEQRPTFCCYDQVSEKQDSFLEWQANEGAAELLVPYEDFIPRFSSWYDDATKGTAYPFVYTELADYYNVTAKVIENRLRTLAYELDQYRSGVPIEDLRILSITQQKRQGINATDYNEFCSDYVISLYDW